MEYKTMKEDKISTLNNDSYNHEIFIYDILILENDHKKPYIIYRSNDNKIVMREKNRKTEYNFCISHLNSKVIGNIYDNPELFTENIKYKKGY